MTTTHLHTGDRIIVITRDVSMENTIVCQPVEKKIKIYDWKT